MSRKFAIITREAFDEFMKKYKAKTSIRSVEGEIVYRIPLQNDLAIWVYSTINPISGESREKGEDAIRTVLMYKNSKAVMKESKTLRTKNWAKNLQDKIDDLQERTTEHRCPWGHPLVKRKCRGGKGSFYGCAIFPDCKYIYKGEKRLSDVYDPKNIPPRVK